MQIDQVLLFWQKEMYVRQRPLALGNHEDLVPRGKDKNKFKKILVYTYDPLTHLKLNKPPWRQVANNLVSILKFQKILPICGQFHCIF